MNRTTRLILSAAVTSAILVPIGASAGPASAKTIPDAGPVVIIEDQGLHRIGDQLVRGDLLTGAGVRAPSWIPQL